MIIDEKSMLQSQQVQQAPPPYVPSSHTNDSASRPAVHPPPFPHHQIRLGIPRLDALPSHILLQIVYMTFPQTSGFDEGKLERQRKTLYWLSTSLRSPYTSDPFPLVSASSPTHAPSYSSSLTQPESIQTIQRETAVLDIFIAVKVREDVWMDDSELHLEREELFKDIFDLRQPRSRVEDLVRIYGVREGIISLGLASSQTSTPTRTGFTPISGYPPSIRASKAAAARPPPTIPFSAISVSFSPRKVGLVLSGHNRSKRTIVEVARTRDEKLEVTAKRLVRELAVWMNSGGTI